MFFIVARTAACWLSEHFPSLKITWKSYLKSGVVPGAGTKSTTMGLSLSVDEFEKFVEAAACLAKTAMDAKAWSEKCVICMAWSCTTIKNNGFRGLSSTNVLPMSSRAMGIQVARHSTYIYSYHAQHHPLFALDLAMPK